MLIRTGARHILGALIFWGLCDRLFALSLNPSPGNAVLLGISLSVAALIRLAIE